MVKKICEYYGRKISFEYLMGLCFLFFRPLIMLSYIFYDKQTYNLGESNLGEIALLLCLALVV